MSNKVYIPIVEMLESLSNINLGQPSVDDIGWFLECKTAGRFTVVERDFVIQTLQTFDSLNFATNNTVTDFKNSWLNRLDTLRRPNSYKR